jgi:hypothetical protein
MMMTVTWSGLGMSFAAMCTTYMFLLISSGSFMSSVMGVCRGGT